MLFSHEFLHGRIFALNCQRRSLLGLEGRCTMLFRHTTIFRNCASFLPRFLFGPLDGADVGDKHCSERKL